MDTQTKMAPRAPSAEELNNLRVTMAIENEFPLDFTTKQIDKDSEEWHFMNEMLEESLIAIWDYPTGVKIAMVVFPTRQGDYRLYRARTPSDMFEFIYQEDDHRKFNN